MELAAHLLGASYPLDVAAIYYFFCGWVAGWVWNVKLGYSWELAMHLLGARYPIAGS